MGFKDMSENTIDLSLNPLDTIKHAKIFLWLQGQFLLPLHLLHTEIPRHATHTYTQTHTLYYLKAGSSCNVFCLSNMCCIGQTPAGTKNMTYYTKQQSCKPRRRIVTSATAFMLYNSLWQVVRKGECSLTTSRDAIYSSAQDNQCLSMPLSEFSAKVSDLNELWYYFIKWFLKSLSSDGTDCDGMPSKSESYFWLLAFLPLHGFNWEGRASE